MQVSLLLTIMSIIVVSVLPGGEGNSELAKDEVTAKRMAKIEEATRAFMAKNLRRPCPSDSTLVTSDGNFGVEAASQGICWGSTPAAPFSEAPPLTLTGDYNSGEYTVQGLASTSLLKVGMFANANDMGGHIVKINSNTQITLDNYAQTTRTGDAFEFYNTAAGGVPTHTLGLPDEYALDGYGRRITYVVDVAATLVNGCHNIQAAGNAGNVRIKDTASATNDADDVMWALLSYGKDGHGAFPAGGSTVAGRFDIGATDADTANNAFAVTGNMGTSTFNGILVKKDKTASFDDHVWYDESTKNTCCIGKYCNFGVRIDGAASEYLGGAGVAVGDINGDGIPDLVIAGTGNNTMRVIFGKQYGWPVGSPIGVGSMTADVGFTITNDNTTSYPNWLGASPNGNGFAVGDVNGDGYDDIVMGYGDSSKSYVKVYFGSATPVSKNLSDLTTTFTLPRTNAFTAPGIAIINVNGDSNGSHPLKDIFALTNNNASGSDGYLFYGKATWGSGVATTMDVTPTGTGLCFATTGFKLSTTDLATIGLDQVFQMGDINGDGIDDFVFSGFRSGYSPNTIPVIFGRADWSGDSTACSGATSSNVNAVTQVGNAAKGFRITSASSTISDYFLAIGDINADGKKDILYNYGANQNKVFYGQSGSTTYNALTSTYGFFANVVTSEPAFVSTLVSGGLIADVNNDGKADMIYSDTSASPNSKAGAGTSIIMLQPQASDFKTAYGASYSTFGKIFKTDGSGLPLNDDVKMGFRIDGAVAGDGAKVVAVADLNADGKNDIIVATPGHGSGAGAIYILWGRNTLPWDESFDLSPLN